jgi:hypothetical protein
MAHSGGSLAFWFPPGLDADQIHRRQFQGVVRGWRQRGHRRAPPVLGAGLPGRAGRDAARTALIRAPFAAQAPIAMP